MIINDIIAQLGSLRDNSRDSLRADPENELYAEDVTACETAIRILAALAGEGCTDYDTVLDVLQDYRSLAKQYQRMHLKYEHPDKPKYKNGALLCPACSSRVQSNRSYCPRCGKRIGWGR